MKRLLLTSSAAALLLIVSSCGITNGERGSGTAETVTFDLDDFAALDVTDTFDVEVVVIDGPFAVTVTVDDNLVDNLDVVVQNDTLRIGFVRGSWRPQTPTTATVSMPLLREIDVSGASSVITSEFSHDSFSLDASGASTVDLSVDTTDLEVDSSGASNVTIRGSGGVLEIDGSGASTLNLDNYSASRASVDLSGASVLTIGELETLNGDVSGASRISVPNSTTVQVDSSGASTVDRTG